jgi:subtilisin-like proprotein convertase family protein
MQMFVFTDPNPDRDGTADADIIIHELTHGTSNRLHGNATGLGSNMSRGMGEGWGDFYAHALLSEPSDPINGTYTTGGWTLLNGFGALGSTNYYYGIRRFPKAVMAFTGGPLNRPHNPLTFADLNVGCDTSDGAFPAATGPHISATCDQVHAAGEIWSSALWEIRSLMVSRLGFTAGTQRALQVVTDGMKLSPVTPTFLDGRDAILQAASAFDPATVDDVWEGFRIRGMGFSAEVLATSPANVVEAFDPPNVTFADSITYLNVTCSDPAFTPVPGDTLAISIPITNTAGTSITNVTATLDGTTTASYGTIASGATVPRVFYYTIPETTTCGDVLSLPIAGSSDIAAMIPATYALQIGIPPMLTTNISNTTLIEVPAVGNTSGVASPFPATVAVSGISDPVIGVTVTLNSLSHAFPDDIDVLLEAPTGENLIVMSDVFGGTDAVANDVAFADSAAELAPLSGPIATGFYKPTNSGSPDTFGLPEPISPYNSPAPAGSATFAGEFSGINPNGTWKLWIEDDASVDSGSIDAGWSLGIITSVAPECPSCGDPFCIPSVDLFGQNVDTTLTVDACQNLTASDFSVLDPNGDVTFTAGNSITLHNGVTVEAGADVTCGIDPSLLPVP